MGSSRSYKLKNARQVAALGSSTRLRIVSDLSVAGPSSVREVAQRLGLTREPLYYHFNILLDVGLLILSGTRRPGRRPEAVYRLVSPKLQIDPERTSKAYTEALIGTAESLLRLAAREYRRAAARGDCVLTGPRRDLFAHRYIARLGPKGIKELNRRLALMFRCLDEHNDAKGGRAIVLTIVVAPP